ncbi:MAG: glutaminase [Duncaniella sp.]|nr:glutaminase [Duncaniella sp.]
MERIIKQSAVEAVVKSAYEKYKDYKVEGSAIDPRVNPAVAGKFAISVRLTDGSSFDYGDTSTLFPLGSLLRLPVMISALMQMSPEEFVKEMNTGKCPVGCDRGVEIRPKGIHAKNLRMVSLVQPRDDADGKMRILSDLMISLMGSSPVLEDKLYEKSMKKSVDEGVENLLATTGYELYESAPVAIEVANKLHSMLVTSRQMARMGAVIAADGRDEVCETSVFDGRISRTVVAMMASKGPKRIKKNWLAVTGVPAMSSFGGGMLAVVPGFGAYSVFAPELVDGIIPAKAAMAAKKIALDLNLNVFASTRIKSVR